MTGFHHPLLEIDSLLAPDLAPRPPVGRTIGRSRAGRPMVGHHFGHGPHKVSLVGGCHADEPVGPAMLDRLAHHLANLEDTHPALRDYQWFLVPHANPDGEARNRPWTGPAFTTPGGDLGQTPDLVAYLRGAVRELPGDDVEFGFPRHQDDEDARPENRAIAEFLRPHGPFALHASFHGMAFAAGPWFLIEHGWADRTRAMRDHLRHRVAALGYGLHDIDRRGDKGFHRIDEGFTSRPDSRAMVEHFEALGDFATAALFRPSSMEWVRSLGGDPLTLVSEMPLFLAPAALYQGDELIRPKALAELRLLAEGAAPGDGSSDGAVRRRAAEGGIRPMPLRDQMRLQLDFLVAGIAACLP